MTRILVVPRAWLVVFFLLACGPFPTQKELRAEVSGVWMVTGSDAIGSYTGRVELLPTGAPQAYRFIRVIDYAPSVVVEDGRSLSWVWEGAATETPGGAVSVTVALQKADFVIRRGGLARTAADALPVQGTGSFEPWMGGLAGRFSGPEINATETWSSAVPTG